MPGALRKTSVWGEAVVKRAGCARRVPEEAPQEIADLVQRCTADSDARPDAAEIADIIQHHLRQGEGRPLPLCRM